MDTKKKHKGIENLIPTTQRTEAEVREIGRKGGIRSGETRRRQKTIKQLLNFIDRQSLPSEQALNLKKVFNIENATFREAVLATIYNQALKGDTKAIELYLKLKGEYPDNIGLKKGDKSLTIIWNETRCDEVDG